MNEPTIKRQKCTGKVPYRSGKLAVKALERWTQKANINRFEFSIYPCEFCGNWHLGRSKFSPEKPIQNDEPHKMNGQLVLFRRSRKGNRSFINYNDPMFNAVSDPNGKWSRGNSIKRRKRRARLKSEEDDS